SQDCKRWLNRRWLGFPITDVENPNSCAEAPQASRERSMVLVLLTVMRMVTRAWLPRLLVLLALSVPSTALAGPLAYVANHQDDNVLVIDTATNQVTDTIDVGNAPLGVAVDPEGAHVYVVNQ